MPNKNYFCEVAIMRGVASTLVNGAVYSIFCIGSWAVVFDSKIQLRFDPVLYLIGVLTMILWLIFRYARWLHERPENRLNSQWGWQMCFILGAAVLWPILGFFASVFVTMAIMMARFGVFEKEQKPYDWAKDKWLTTTDNGSG
jgi:hypothetical protein